MLMQNKRSTKEKKNTSLSFVGESISIVAHIEDAD
jgi:hypothetical protein